MSKDNRKRSHAAMTGDHREFSGANKTLANTHENQAHSGTEQHNNNNNSSTPANHESRPIMTTSTTHASDSASPFPPAESGLVVHHEVVAPTSFDLVSAADGPEVDTNEEIVQADDKYDDTTATGQEKPAATAEEVGEAEGQKDDSSVSGTNTDDDLETAADTEDGDGEEEDSDPHASENGTDGEEEEEGEQASEEETEEQWGVSTYLSSLATPGHTAPVAGTLC
jgi:hypothetical protein